MKYRQDMISMNNVSFSIRPVIIFSFCFRPFILFLEESDNGEEQGERSTSRRTSIASSAATLNRRGSDDESEDDTIVIDRRKGFKSRKIENAQDIFLFCRSGYLVLLGHFI